METSCLCVNLFGISRKSILLLNSKVICFNIFFTNEMTASRSKVNSSSMSSNTGISNQQFWWCYKSLKMQIKNSNQHRDLLNLLPVCKFLIWSLYNVGWFITEFSKAVCWGIKTGSSLSETLLQYHSLGLVSDLVVWALSILLPNRDIEYVQRWLCTKFIGV